MRTSGIFLFVVVLTFAISACTGSSVVTDGLRPAEFAQALDGERAVIRLRDGRTIRADIVYISADSTRYIETPHPFDPKPWVMTSATVPTASISYIDVTRPRKSHRAGNNLAAGMALGLSAGILVYKKEMADIRADAEACTDSCIHLGFAAEFSKLLILIGALAGIAAGAIFNMPRPSDRYYLFVEGGGRVWFRKVER